jgi:pyruvyltransferase
MNKIPLFYYSINHFHASSNNFLKLSSLVNFKSKKENYGELLSKYIVEKISKQKVKLHDPRKAKSVGHYFGIGSIFAFTNSKSVVWGSGIIDVKHPVANCNFRAVRGPQSRGRLIEFGYHCPPVYGDPALLMPLFFNPKVEVKYSLGIVPHFRDFNRAKSLFENVDGIKSINLLTNNIEETTSEILSC